MSGYSDQLWREFADAEYRHSYAEDHLNTSIATQIRVLREDRSMKQSELAEKSNTQQSVISRVENVNYESWSIKTLKRLAVLDAIADSLAVLESHIAMELVGHFPLLVLYLEGPCWEPAVTVPPLGYWF